MSKINKLFRHPVLFFADAGKNFKRRIARADHAAPQADVSAKIPTYIFGFSPWKQYMKSWFPERNLVFLPKLVKKEEFDRLWKAKILNDPRAEVFIWGFKVEPWVFRFIESNHIKAVYVEDGFIRSIGLGATKTPPFSLSMDTQTPYFDARRPSDLEDLLNGYDFEADSGLMERAGRLMQVLLDSGLSKYNHAAPVDIARIYGPKTVKRILVVGQVEDDASIQFGCNTPFTNNDAVIIAAMENPGAQIIFKPHPDVLNGHRAMKSSPDDVSHICHVLRLDVPLAQAFETIDHVYTITSQAGFEALMRGIKVTTLGCPFYSGWGLTDDRQPNPRRKRCLTLPQLFAAAYLLYPRYFDPVYKTSLSAEMAVERLIQYKNLERSSSGINNANDKNASVSNPGKGIDDRIPTFVFGPSPCKEFMCLNFPERKFKFLPSTIKRRDINEIMKTRILKDFRSEIFIWGSKFRADIEAFAQSSDIKLVYLQNGFISPAGFFNTQSHMFSFIIDSLAPYYDSRGPSELENILNHYDFDADEDLMIHAQSLLQLLLQTDQSVIEQTGCASVETLYGPKTTDRVLVIGHAEYSDSLRYGSNKPYTNNDLVMIAAIENPNAQIIFKPHPDAISGKCVIKSDPAEVSHLCLVLTEDVPLARALETVDHVYSITSRAGFEALLRGIKVTTLGCPFYAGWGLGDDRQANERRTRKLDLLQVFAGAYLLYPRYFDPFHKDALPRERIGERYKQLQHLQPRPMPTTMEPEVAKVPEHTDDETQIKCKSDIELELDSLRNEIADLRKLSYQNTLGIALQELMDDFSAVSARICTIQSKIGDM